MEEAEYWIMKTNTQYPMDNEYHKELAEFWLKYAKIARDDNQPWGEAYEAIRRASCD